MMVQDWKKSAVDVVAKEIDKWPVVALADMRKMPAAQIQKIRAALRGEAEVKMAKKSIIDRAAEKSKKKEIKKLVKEAGLPALIFSKVDAVKLYNKILENKSEAFIKAGEIAPFDIVVPAGKTSLPPGPLVSDLQKAGIKAAIKGPNIEILETKVVAKAGEKVKPEVADALQKLGIKPLSLELNLAGVLSEGLLFSQNVLKENTPQAIQAKITLLFRDAVNLAVNSGVFEKESVEIMISKAQAEALALKALVGQ